MGAVAGRSSVVTREETHVIPHSLRCWVGFLSPGLSDVGGKSSVGQNYSGARMTAV